MHDEITPSVFINETRRKIPHSFVQNKAWFEKFLAGEIADYQMSAWLMAVVLQGLTFQETADITDIFVSSGERIMPAEFERTAVDKHSTGGVGDKTTFILAPIVAASGLIVPMISGRSLGHTGGTLDKLEAIPGFTTQLSREQFLKQCNEHGLAIIGQTAKIAPLDKRIYALRDVTGTVESFELICASILSKKLAEGLNGLVMDVKFGTGAFIEDYADAKKLAQMLVNVGKALNLRVQALLTDMNQPLGLYSGNLLEIIESYEILQGQHTETSATQLSLTLASRMFAIGLKIDVKSAQKLAQQTLQNGKAFELFERMVYTQTNGQNHTLEKLQKLQDSNSQKIVVKAEKTGFIEGFETKKIGWLLVEFGGGRKKVTDEINPFCGFKKLKSIGEEIVAGDEIFEIFAPKNVDSAQAEYFSTKLRDCVEIGGNQLEMPLVSEIID
ncbi:MAG: thymidine phosphorylase [Planctomycetes bacterium]|nr:thymidine phosphorylase [Planctomycetota bacterium]